MSMNEPTQGEKELSQLVADLKAEQANEEADPPAPAMKDRRTPEQRRLDFLADLNELIERDRVVPVWTVRHLPDGRSQGGIEWFPVDDRADERKKR